MPQILDLKRIFLGDLPWTFTLEIVLRTSVMYLYALLVIRLVGKRAMGQLSLFEFAIIIALGSAVGDPMFYADVPLLHGMVVVTMVIFLHRGLIRLTHSSQSVEAFVEGAPRRLVVEGRLDLQGLASESFSRDELFAALRLAGIEQLGQVKRAYLEQSGSVSTFRYAPRDVRPGLPLIPPWDIDRPTPVAKGEIVSQAGHYSCYKCGDTLRLDINQSLPACPYCGGLEWTPATKRPIEV